MDRDEFERCRATIEEATAALNVHLDSVQDSMFGSETGTGGSIPQWLAEYDRLVRIRDRAEADLAARL